MTYAKVELEQVTTQNPESSEKLESRVIDGSNAEYPKKPSFFARIHTFDSLSIRDYRLLWLGQVDTSLGQWMDSITRGYLIYHITS